MDIPAAFAAPRSLDPRPLTFTELIALRREASRVIRDGHEVDTDMFIAARDIVTLVDDELLSRSFASLVMMLTTEAALTQQIGNHERHDMWVPDRVRDERDNATLAIDAVVKAADAIDRRHIIR